jgi:hypothetical protein
MIKYSVVLHFAMGFFMLSNSRILSPSDEDFEKLRDQGYMDLYNQTHLSVYFICAIVILLIYFLVTYSVVVFGLCNRCFSTKVKESHDLELKDVEANSDNYY